MSRLRCCAGALDAANLGDTEKLHGFRRLDKLTRAVEQQHDPLADFSAATEHEHAISESVGGRTVFDDGAVSRKKVERSPQLSLFPE